MKGRKGALFSRPGIFVHLPSGALAALQAVLFCPVLICGHGVCFALPQFWGKPGEIDRIGLFVIFG